MKSNAAESGLDQSLRHTAKPGNSTVELEGGFVCSALTRIFVASRTVNPHTGSCVHLRSVGQTDHIIEGLVGPMSVEVECPSCQKSYKVKAEAAGKKFRCKACETVITVPQPEAAEASFLDVDPWDAVDESAPPPPPMPRRVKSSSAERSSRRSSSDGMPVTVMVSIGICGLLLALHLFGLVSTIVMENINKSQIGGSLLRIGIGITIIKGLLDRSNRIRWNAIVLDIIGLVFVIFCMGVVLIVNQQAAMNQLGVDEKTGLIVIFGVQFVLWIVDLVMLSHSSARDYCNQ